ncbi:MAG: alkylhydroperoxidase [Acidobacteria bacterium]|jgi:uncharacterized peroxidase-related enzyme|nr:alkylhydroperoxidase [Acidobacteriota bacterium]
MCFRPRLLLATLFSLVSLTASAAGQLENDSQGIAVPFSWIRVVPYEASQGELRRLYDIVGGASGNIDNVVKVHSLRPHTLEGHYTLYRAVLHDPANQLPAWFLEALGVYTSLLNHGHYSVAHHALGFRHALNQNERADTILEALESDQPDSAFAGKELALLRYARQLTLTPGHIEKGDVERLRSAGATDGEILEVNQVVAYFNYANRVLNGLGVTTEGDVLGTSPRTR